MSYVRAVLIKTIRLLMPALEENDWNFPGAGNGDLPLREFIEYMASNGYEGPYSVEIEYAQEFCMREKDQSGDIGVADKEMADSYKFLTEVLR